MSKDTPKRYWLVAGFYAFFEKGAGYIFGFGSVYVLYRTLTKEAMGVWVLFLAVCAFLEVSRMGLIQNALVKFLSSEEETEHGKINTASLFSNFLLILGFIAFLLLAAPVLAKIWNSADLIPLLQIYALTTFVLTPMYQCNFIQQANLDFRGIFWSNLVRQGPFFFFVLALWLLNKPIELIELAQFQVFTAILGSVVSFLFARKYLQFASVIDWSWIKKLLNFGKYAVSTNLSIMLYKSMDQMMLGGMVSTTSVAIYNLAIRITNLMEVPTFSAAAVVYPQSAREMAQNGKRAVKQLYEQSVGVILAFLIPIIAGVELFPELIITIIAGEEYLDAVPLLQLTILFGLFLPFGSQMGTVLESIGKPNINFYCTVFGFLLNIIANYLFISWYGTIGAAYGTLLIYFLSFIITQFILYKLLKVNTLNVFVNIWNYYRKGFFLFKKKINYYFFEKIKAIPSEKGSMK